MLEKTLMFKCSLLTIRTEENGMSNVYIDKLMEKISRSFNGTFSIDNIPVFDDDAHADLHVELVSPNNDWSLTVDNDDKKLVSGKDPYTDDHFKHFTHREVNH